MIFRINMIWENDVKNSFPDNPANPEILSKILLIKNETRQPAGFLHTKWNAIPIIDVYNNP